MSKYKVGDRIEYINIGKYQAGKIKKGNIVKIRGILFKKYYIKRTVKYINNTTGDEIEVINSEQIIGLVKNEIGSNE